MLVALPLADGRTLLAYDDAHTVRLWDPVSTASAGTPLSGHSGSVNMLATVPLADGRTLLASGGRDGTVRLWDPVSGQPVHSPLTGQDDHVQALAVVRLADGRTLVASAGDEWDATVRLWDPVNGQAFGMPMTGPTTDPSRRWSRCRWPMGGLCSPPPATTRSYDYGIQPPASPWVPR